MKLEFSRTDFSKNALISNFRKSPVRVETFHGDGQTDMTNQIVVFRNFAKAPKNVIQNYKNCKYQLHYEEDVFAESLKPSRGPVLNTTGLAQYTVLEITSWFSQAVFSKQLYGETSD
jgi:hypothetical protein